MTTQQLLFVLTFVFGVLQIVLQSKLFSDVKVIYIDDLIPITPVKDDRGNIILISWNLLSLLVSWLGMLFYHFSLIYQTWYWFIYICKLE